MNNSNKPKRRGRKNVNKTSENSDHREPDPLFAGDDGAERSANDDNITSSTPEPPDPFDPAALRINPDTAAGAIGVKRKILVGEVWQAGQDGIRPRPPGSNRYRIDTALIQDKTNRESYLVAPPLWPELPDFISLVRLCVAVNRHGTPFLWPAKLPDPNGRPMDWHTSMLEAQELAVKNWVRVQADMSAGSYAVFEATGQLARSTMAGSFVSGDF